MCLQRYRAHHIAPATFVCLWFLGSGPALAQDLRMNTNLCPHLSIDAENDSEARLGTSIR